MLCLRRMMAAGLMVGSLTAFGGCQPPAPPAVESEPVVAPGSPNTTADEGLAPSPNTTTDEALAPAPTEEPSPTPENKNKADDTKTDEKAPSAEKDKAEPKADEPAADKPEGEKS